MEYIKLLIPFIAGAFTTPIIEGIKNSLLFQKKEKLVMIEIADILEDISSCIGEVMCFLRNDVGEYYGYKNISAESLCTPMDIDIIFLKENMESFYIRSHKNSRVMIKKIFKISEDLKKHQQNILEIRKETFENSRTNNVREMWVLYYNYLSCACSLKEVIKGFMLNEEVEFLDYNENIRRECADRGFDYSYSYFYHNFSSSNNFEKSLRKFQK